MTVTFITNMCTHYGVRLFELLSKRHDVNFYFTGGDEHYWNKSNKLPTGNIQVEHLKGFFIFPGIKIIPGLFCLFFKKTDIVIKTVDGRFAFPFIFLIAKLRRKPFILWTGLWFHPKTFIHKVTFPFTRFIYNHADAIVTYGEHVKRYLMNLDVKSEKIFCTHHSIDNDVLNKTVSAKETSELRSDLGLFEEKIILYVGRLEKCKGLDFLIDGLSKIKHLGFTLLFIGNGSQEEALKADCKELSVKCHFLGHIANQDLYRYYALADIFVLPSITTKDFKEPWGLVVNEAMNQGCAVVTTEAVGAARGGLVKHQETGLIVPERDSGALQVAIETLLKDEVLLISMGQAAQKEVGNWSPERMSEGFIQAIHYVQEGNEI